MAATQKNRFLSIKTALGGDTLMVKSVTISEQLGRLFQMEVDLRSEDRAIKFDDLVGTNATILLKTPSGGKRYFNGFISRFVQVEHQGSFAIYRATLVPWFWFLTRAADCRIFQKKKVPDIIEEVFKAQGFKDYQLKLSGSYGEWDFCVQYRETDFNFVSRLMEQEGIYYHFEHKDGAHTLVLTDSKSAHEPFPGYDTLTFRPPTSRSDESTETVTDWVLEKEVQPGIYALGDFNHETPKAAITGNANVSRQHASADFEIYDYPGEFEDRGEGEGYAKIRIQELQTQHEIVRAQASVRGISTGCKFTLKGHHRSDQDRAYLITSASFQIDAGEYEAGKAGSGEFYACSFTAIPLTEQFRSARTTPKPLIQGPQTAIVVGPKGEEIHTDDQSRVKVHFHWDRHGGFDENASCWVRVSQALAGKSWGFVNVPRIGQEVIIEFLEGDPDRPIITGRVYNTDQTPPYELPANKTQSGFKSRSSKSGTGDNFNEIRFEDLKGSEEVFIHAEKDQTIEVENDETHSVGNNREKTIGADETTTVKGNRTETVKKDEEISVEGNQSVEVKKDASLTVDGKRSHSVTKDETVDIGGKRTTSVTKDDESTISGNQTTTVEKDSTVKITGQMTLTIDKKYTAKVTDSIAIQGDKDILLECGSAKVLLKQDGKVQIEGSDVNVKASGNVKIKGSSIAVN